ncbi:MAG: glycosyl hydrolase 115 family protein [Prevotellaceae bacterium]|jgi:hypothetical protein|nr:glycosyl hydrolase 115 family protein [Prevotellaceae bacterium]
MKKIPFILFLACIALQGFSKDHNGIASFVQNDNAFPLAVNGQVLPIVADAETDKGVARAVDNLRSDFERVTQSKPELLAALPPSGHIIIVGVAGQSKLIDQLILSKKIDGKQLQGKREKYLLQTVAQPFDGIEEALVIAGSDKRGAIYGVYELSEQIGVSPWYYWADVPVKQSKNIALQRGVYTNGEPAVDWRGIFLNDEAPALSGWSRETFGGFNSKFYEKVFELILRLRGNFLWPAMWGSAFYDDDPLNGALAHEMGVVIGTSHHEPLGRAHDEWRRYGSGEWNYQKNPAVLTDFWKGGMERMKSYEALVTVGMRGDGDEAMSEGTNIALLENIVKEQRKIIADVTQKKAEQTPQVWALYKEVQDYYDKGMRVPDDVTLLLCDDNWGNVRKLPDLQAKPRKGGYGMYYHFDYVGGPRNYKWLNVMPVQKTWEQMELCYEYGVRKLWVVNVGDLKPMEYPITFFLDMAWNPAQFNAGNLVAHTERFCAQQFGEQHAQEAARLINLYTKYNRRITPELLNDATYSLENYHEFERVATEYRALLTDALRLYHLLGNEYRDAFDQLVLFPINACSNLYDMYYAVAQNKKYAKVSDAAANEWAEKAKACFARDSILTYHYNKVMAGGKWNHIMDQTHIGYTYWQQPPTNAMPKVEYVATDGANRPALFVEKDGYVSIEAEHFARSQGADKIRWEVIPHLGKTLSGVTVFPRNIALNPTEEVYLEYDILFASTDTLRVEVITAPTLNFNANKGLRYAVSLDGGAEQVVNINGHYRGELGKWQGENQIKTVTTHTIANVGKHTLRVRALDAGIVLHKILINAGGLKPSYLGAPESEKRNLQ